MAARRGRRSPGRTRVENCRPEARHEGLDGAEAVAAGDRVHVRAHVQGMGCRKGSNTHRLHMAVVREHLPLMLFSRFDGTYSEAAGTDLGDWPHLSRPRSRISSGFTVGWRGRSDLGRSIGYPHRVRA